MIVCAALLGALGACKQEPAAPAATYTVRGEIKGLPEAGGSELFVHHEAIPGFVDHAGKEVGMMSMTMPFVVGPDVSLEGLAVGDKVVLTFAVHWDKSPPTQITAIRELPAETELELSGM